MFNFKDGTGRCLVSFPEHEETSMYAAVSFATFLLAQSVCAMTPPTPDSPEKGALMKERYTKMINALANKNPEPKLVKETNGRRPVFSRNYDWDEQVRVRRALVALAESDDEILWRELLEHFGDRRYSLTMTEDGHYAFNYSVGRLCQMLANHRARAAFEQYLPDGGFGRPVYVELDLGDLRKVAEQMPLYQIQIAACEQALEQISSHSALSTSSKREAIAAIKRQVSLLKESQEPVTVRFLLDSLEMYDKRYASGHGDDMAP